MKIDRNIRAMPWPEPYRGGVQGFAVTLAWPVVDGERLLVATFSRNREKKTRLMTGYGPDFRLVCSKKRGRVRALYQGVRAAKQHDLERALEGFGYGGGSGPVCGYPEISGKDERALLRWLGVLETSNHGMPELSAWTREAVEAEKQTDRAARGELRDEDVYLCPDGLPQGLEDYIRKTVLPEDNVLLYKRGNVRGTCFQCRRRVRARQERFIQNQEVVCPYCGRVVKAVLEGSGVYASANVENVVTLQRGRDVATVFLRQWRLLRDPSAQWADIPRYLKETARYAVRGVRAAKWQREKKYNWYMNTQRYDLTDWERIKKTSEIYDGAYYFYLPPDWRAQVDGTCLQYVDLDGYLHSKAKDGKGTNPVRFLLDWARYPAVEKLWKAGYTRAVYERIHAPNREHQGAVDWRRNSIRDAIGFPARLLKTYPPEEWTLARFQRGRDVWALVGQGKLREPEAACLLDAGVDLTSIELAMGRAPLRRILRYLQGRDALIWRDYLKDCQTLGLDLDDRAVLFPPNLDAAHQGTISQIYYKRDQAKWEAFSRVLGKLSKLAWAPGGLLIRPPADAGEVIAEGQVLKHCVGRYIDDMAKGDTVILFIRRAEEPDKPYYTLEWRRGQVVQCRTRYNQSYWQDPEVKAFVDAWVDHIRKTDRQRKETVA